MPIITNKTVWVTGASSGIGYALAEALAANKNYVFVTARSEHKLAKLVEQYPDHIKPIVADVGDKNDMANAQNVLNKHSDHLDLVVLCAGTCEYQDGDRIDTDMYNRVFSVNFMGAVNTVSIAIPLLKRSIQSPQVIGISSLSTVVPFSRAEAYGSSKAALEYFLRSLRIDLADHGIDVAVIRPGFVDTPMTQKNDFDMPFMISEKQACQYILRAIEARKNEYSFPWKLSWPLYILSSLPNIWEKIVAPKLKRKESF